MRKSIYVIPVGRFRTDGTLMEPLGQFVPVPAKHLTNTPVFTGCKGI
ncbi:hypothetical protein [Agriterribacter humi]|nr:hypothetical protein [Agriterribacter humi]